MLKAALVFTLLASPALANPGMEALEALEARRAECVGWMMGGYPSGIEEKACRAEFALPSAFLFKCMAGLQAGFASTGERRACAGFLARAAEAAERAYVAR